MKEKYRFLDIDDSLPYVLPDVLLVFLWCLWRMEQVSAATLKYIYSCGPICY